MAQDEASGLSMPSTPKNELASESDEGERPPLPPRPSLVGPKASTRPPLRSDATTALSLTDIETQGHSDGSRDTYVQYNVSTPPRFSLSAESPRRNARSRPDSEADSSSIHSFPSSQIPSGDIEALLEEALGDTERSLERRQEAGEGFVAPNVAPFSEEDPYGDFEQEFQELEEISADGSNEEALLHQWKGKWKHFHILSAAGKPIYNRHGSDNLVSGEIGVIQTIVSFYEGASDQLSTFVAGKTRFVVMTRGPLYLVAISRLGESEAQLRNQLEALYMQILSTLTLPRLTSMFSFRPSTDLRRPLQGTDSLLSALADSFTRGSPSTLLSSLECLKLKKSQRQTINHTMLKVKCQDLLYGLIVAGRRLVSVVRPRTHSLHPGDLQLIFNMLFEARGVEASGGDAWIPMCLPGFNKSGYLYMFVSFLDVVDETKDLDVSPSRINPEDRIAIIFISAKKESFFDLQQMKDEMVSELQKNGHLDIIRSAVLQGRPLATDIAPGTVLRHFLYKSRGNLQFFMPAYEPHFRTVLERRRLFTLYHRLHADIHAKSSHLKVHYCLGKDSTSLAWVTPMFELFCVAPPTAARNALAQSATKIVQWVRREEERVFIIGGAVF